MINQDNYELKVEDKKVKSFNKFLNSAKPSNESSIQSIDQFNAFTKEDILVSNANPKEEEIPTQVVPPLKLKQENTNKLQSSKQSTQRKPSEKVPSPPEKVENRVPKIDSFSSVLSEKGRQERTSKKLWEGLYDMHKKKEEKLLNMLTNAKMLEEEKIKSECSFTPNLIAASKTEKQGNIYDRSVQWKQASEEKTKNRQMEKSKVDEEECRFSPSIIKEQSVVQPSSDVRIKNVDKHLQRIRNAELEKDFKKQCLNKYSGKTWKQKITIPEEYSLSASPNRKHTNEHAKSPIQASDVIKEVLIDESTPFDEAQRLLHEKLSTMEL